MDVESLDVAEIVGPPYAVLTLEPTLGPLTGDRGLIVRGINFPEGKVCVKFTNGEDEEIVEGCWVDSSTVKCVTAGFEKYGAQAVDVKVSPTLFVELTPTPNAL